MAEFRTDGGGVLCEDLVRKVFEYDGHAEEARAACIAKGWGDVRRGPPWMIETGPGYTTCVTISADNSMLAVCNNIGYNPFYGPYRDGPPYYKHETVRPVPGMTSFSTNGTNIKRNELDLFGLGPGPQFTSNSVFSRDASIMVMQDGTFRTSKKIALYDVATGRLRLKKRPPGRG